MCCSVHTRSSVNGLSIDIRLHQWRLWDVIMDASPHVITGSFDPRFMWSRLANWLFHFPCALVPFHGNIPRRSLCPGWGSRRWLWAEQRQVFVFPRRRCFEVRHPFSGWRSAHFSLQIPFIEFYWNQNTAIDPLQCVSVAAGYRVSTAEVGELVYHSL